MAFERSVASSPFGVAEDVATGIFVATSADRSDWRPAPINAAWILDGRPVARIVPLARGRDTLGSTSLWDCTQGTFTWTFAWDETVHILEGAVTVTLPGGEVHRLTAGSVAFFPGGSTAVWKVEGYVRKLAVCRRVLPGPLARLVEVARVFKRMGERVRAQRADFLGPFSPVIGRGRLAAATAFATWICLDFVFDLV